MIRGIFLSLVLSLTPNLDQYSCTDFDSNSLIRNEIMLQIILKNYGYYESKIDGDFGPASKKALKEFQNSNDLISDGILGNNTCNALINRQSIVRKTSNTNSISNSQSTVIFNAQKNDLFFKTKILVSLTIK